MTETEDMGTIGYFLNMLPIRLRLQNSDSFDAVAKMARDSALAALSHSHAPFDMILGSLGLSRSSPHHPLFQVAVNYRKASLNETDFGIDGKIEWQGAVLAGHPYDLLLNVATTSD
jgi:non-ribosomal peptide synthetase component F